MLVNLSYNNPKLKQQINQEVGAPFNLRERWRLGGIGSQKLTISFSSIEIHNLLVLDHDTNSCSIEIRPNGIIVRFRSLLETYGLIIPYYKLNIYKGKAEEYSIYRDNYCMKVIANKRSIHAFFKKITAQKLNNMPPSVDEL